MWLQKSIVLMGMTIKKCTKMKVVTVPCGMHHSKDTAQFAHKVMSVLQIRSDRDSLGIISHISP